MGAPRVPSSSRHTDHSVPPCSVFQTLLTLGQSSSQGSSRKSPQERSSRPPCHQPSLAPLPPSSAGTGSLENRGSWELTVHADVVVCEDDGTAPLGGPAQGDMNGAVQSLDVLLLRKENRQRACRMGHAALAWLKCGWQTPGCFRRVLRKRQEPFSFGQECPGCGWQLCLENPVLESGRAGAAKANGEKEDLTHEGGCAVRPSWLPIL